MRNSLFWISLPFLLPQALRIRKKAVRCGDAGGPNRGTIGNGQPKSLLVFGDSIAAGVGAATYENALAGRTAAGLADAASVTVRWRSVGYSGATCEQVLRKLDAADGEDRVDFVVLSVGVNDVTALTTIPAWRRNLSSLVQRLDMLYQEPVIVLVGLPPFRAFPSLPLALRNSMQLRANSIDAASREVVANFKNVHFAPMLFEPSAEKFAADGYHPSEAGYVEYGQKMGELLANLDGRRRAVSFPN